MSVGILEGEEESSIRNGVMETENTNLDVSSLKNR